MREDEKIAKKQVLPRTNRISKKKKGSITVGEATAHDGAAKTLTAAKLRQLAPKQGPSARGPPDSAVFISAAQVCARYGGMSDMWLWRMLERDPTFPRPFLFGGKRRFFKLDELVAWERANAPKASWGKSGRPRKRAA